MTAYDVDDRARVSFTLKDINGNLTNGTVTFVVTDPTGATSSPAVVNDSTGQYHADVDLPTKGRWSYRWKSTGAVIAAEDGWLLVEAPVDLTAYTTIAELKSRLGPMTVTTNDDLVERAVRVASRAVDEYCGRTGDGFATGAVSARRYRARDELLFVDDIATLTGLVVKTGTPGGYNTTLTLDTDFVVEPANALAKGRPVTALRHIRNYAWVNFWFWYNNLPNIEVTASWGWPRVPDQVREATLIKAARLFRRKDSPDGVLGNSDFGTVYVSRYDDPDVIALLEPFVRAEI